MKTVIVASLRPNAGKTSIILGLAKAIGKKFSYLKPFGERVLYRKKRLLDYDSALVKNLFHLDENPEEMSIGFDHSKLRYIYDEKTIAEKLVDMKESIEEDRDILFVEAGKDLMYGSSVGLDPFSISRDMDGRMIIIVSGEDDSIIDDLIYIKKHVDLDSIDFGGLLINKVKDIEDFKMTHMDRIDELGMKIIGIIPFCKELTYLSIDYINDVLFAKVLSGHDRLSNQVKEIYIGAMSGDVAMKNPLFSKEMKLIITSGDREDMCIAAINSDTAGIILTNNILPPTSIIKLAEDKGIPMLLVPGDTFKVAKQIDDMERLITRNDSSKVDQLGRVISNNADLSMVLD